MKISAFWILVAIVAGILLTYLYMHFIYLPQDTVSVNERSDYDLVMLKLPTSKNSMVFGPKYWEAYNFLDKNIPCALCRNKAVPLGTFRHDIVNAMTESKNFPFDKENWKYWVAKVNELDKKVIA